MKTPSPFGLIATAGGIVVALGGILAFWGDWGWIPGKQYRAEHVSETSADEIAEKLAAFMDAWQCDEWSEEIPVLSQSVDRLERRVLMLEEGTLERDRLEKIYYRVRQDRDNKQDAFDELNCEAIVK